MDHSSGIQLGQDKLPNRCMMVMVWSLVVFEPLPGNRGKFLLVVLPMTNNRWPVFLPRTHTYGNQLVVLF